MCFACGRPKGDTTAAPSRRRGVLEKGRIERS